MLKDIFTALVLRYTGSASVAGELWREIEQQYSNRKRHYHNLAHLDAVIDQLQDCRALVKEWDTLLFSVFYHDIVYNVMKNDNEEQSAEAAVKRLAVIGVKPDKIERCKKQILATKTHASSNDPDTDLFTDADLSVLGQPTTVYKQYCLQVRKEYSIYPDIIYKPGRRKVINHFLAMERIYKTPHFFNRYEMQARENMTTELLNL
ncbi:MAG: hypothetical protein QM791_19680 [Ferruginibacter sp.]